MVVDWLWSLINLFSLDVVALVEVVVTSKYGFVSSLVDFIVVLAVDVGMLV